MKLIVLLFIITFLTNCHSQSSVLNGVEVSSKEKIFESSNASKVAEPEPESSNDLEAVIEQKPKKMPEPELIETATSQPNSEPEPIMQEEPKSDSEKILVTYKPALAVRGAACLICHAKVKGNLVTDYGFGDDFFLGYHPVFESNRLGSKYSDWGDKSWSSAKFFGDLLVPKASINFPSLLEQYNVNEVADFTNMSLADYLLEPFYVDVSKESTTTRLQKYPATDKGFDEVDPGLYGTVEEKDLIKIYSPTKDRINSLIQEYNTILVQNSEGTGLIYGSADSEIKGDFELAEEHIVIKDLEECSGDLIVTTNILFDEAKVITPELGCRFYITGHVFIKGFIDIQGAPASNVQISSASSIQIGMAYMENRFRHLYGTRQINTLEAEEAFKDEVRTITNLTGMSEDAGPIMVLRESYQGSVTAISYEGHISSSPGFEPVWIGVTPNNDFNDPGLIVPDVAQVCSPTSLGPCKEWAGSFMRKLVDQKRLLLNAQTINSRYHGTFKGAIIGEDVLFAVGNFKFEYDDVFNEVPFLPLLSNQDQHEILDIK